MKRIRRKPFALLTALIMVLSMIPMSVFAESKGNNFDFIISYDKNAHGEDILCITVLVGDDSTD